jgi:hypothetical protein
VRKLLALLLLSAGAVTGTNFAWVQKASSNTNSVAFASSNTAGNIIVVQVIEGSGPVSDTQGNTYALYISMTGSSVKTYAAAHIHAGANTVTVTTGPIVIMEYSSVSAGYWICPGHASLAVGVEAGTITNQNVNGTGTNFNSASEVMVVFGAWENGTAHNCSIPSGTIRLNGITPGTNDGYCFGDDLQTSMTGAYNNTPFYIEPLPSYPTRSSDIFLALSNGGSGCVGAGGASAGTFSILY